jgi:hypothetical protein
MPRAIRNVGGKTLCQKKMRMLRSTMGTPGIMTKILGTTLKAQGVLATM